MAGPFPDSIEGYSIGAELRTSGVLCVRSGRSKLDLPVQAFAVRADALKDGFEADDFLAGVRRAAAVQHEALLPFVTGGRTGDFVYGIAKSGEGATLAAQIAGNGPFGEPRVLALGASVAGALAALERGGMRHGDLSPDRILIAGLDAFVAEPPRILPAALAPRAERWQSPEEARGGENGVQSDQFVLGLLLWFALTGSQPVAATNEPRRALRDWRTPDPTGPLRMASPELRTVIARLLAAEPANRFPTATDALRALQDVAASRPETAPIALAPPSMKTLTEAARRPPGRLVVETRFGEALLEIDDDVVHVGAEAGKTPKMSARPFAEAIVRIERTPAADVIVQVAGDLTVNGRPASSQSLAEGDRVTAPGLTARYERAPRPASRAAPSAPPPPPPTNAIAGIVTAAALVGTLAALGWGGWRVIESSKEAGDAKQLAARAEQLRDDATRKATPGGSETPAAGDAPPAMELTARTAYENAERAARAKPADARAKFYEVWQRFPDTAYGQLARLDALEIDRRARPGADPALEAMLASAETAEGGLDADTVSKLRTYVEEHAGTLAAARAHVALVRSQAIQRGRFDADLAALRAAIAKKDWAAARTLLSRARESAPPGAGSEIDAELRKIEEGGGASPPPPPGGDPRKPPPAAGKPADDPPAGDSLAERNRRAEELFRGGKKLMDSGKELEALDVFIEFLRVSKETPNGEKYAPEVASRLTGLTNGPAGIVRLFRGKVERAADKNRWRFTYDFDDARQLEDFKDVLAFEAPPRSSWRSEGGAVRASRGSGAFVLDARFTADEISVAAKIATDRPHDLGVMLMDPTESRRFYLFTLQNTYFTLGLDAGSKPFLENAIVLFGPDMWAKTPKGEIGFVRKCGLDEPRILPGELTPVRCGKSAGEVWMKFEGGRSMRGSAFGDKEYTFPGLLPGFFVLGSTGTFDELVIEGTLDPKWVADRWAAILRGL